MVIDRRRFESLLPQEAVASQRVALLGAGGLGSYIAPILTRMGVHSWVLVDFDRVEAVNVATQDYPAASLGRLKVEALADRLREVEPEVEVQGFPGRVETLPQQALEGVTLGVLAADNMAARRTMYGKLKRAACMMPPLVVDPRMGAEVLEVYAFRLGDAYQEQYEKLLQDRHYAQEPCGARAIAYTGALAAAVLGSLVRRAFVGEDVQGWMGMDLGVLGIRNYFHFEEERR